LRASQIASTAEVRLSDPGRAPLVRIPAGENAVTDKRKQGRLYTGDEVVGGVD
jgi:hypothetical protein